MLWKNRNQAVALATMLMVGGACGNGDGAKGKEATGLDVAKYTKSNYIAEEAKKTSSEIDSGTKKVEDVRADIRDQVTQWRSCVQNVVPGYSPGQTVKTWENGLDRCSNVELGYMREVADSLTRFTCKVNPEDDVEKIVASADVLTGTLKKSEKNLGLSRLCTPGQMIYTEVDKVIQIARAGGGVVPTGGSVGTNDFGEQGMFGTGDFGSGDTKREDRKKKESEHKQKCSKLKTQLREERKKVVAKKREAEKAWRDKNKKQTDQIWGRASDKELEDAEEKYEKLKSEFENMKTDFNDKVEDYKYEEDCGYDVSPVFDHLV